MTPYQEAFNNGFNNGFNDGLERAAIHLQCKAHQMRDHGNITANTMARIYEEEAEQILALRRKGTA